jgi:hypothetical protein
MGQWYLIFYFSAGRKVHFYAPCKDDYKSLGTVKITEPFYLKLKVKPWPPEITIFVI